MIFIVHAVGWWKLCYSVLLKKFDNGWLG